MIHKLVKQRREELGLTIVQVANALNVSPSTITRFENNEIHNISLSKLMPLSEILRCDPAWLLGVSDDPDVKRYPVTLEEEQILMAFRRSDPTLKKVFLKLCDVITEK